MSHDEYSQIDTHKGIIAWFARNSVAANLLMAIIISTGLWSAFNMERAMQPDIFTNLIIVNVPYPGAAPGEVELGVVLKIEEAIRDIESIESIESRSLESMASIYLEIKDNYDVLAVLDEVKSAVDGISNMPEQAEKPVIQHAQFRTHSLSLQLVGNLDEKRMSALANEVRDDLMQNPDIGTIDIYGLREYELAIEISSDTLHKYGLSLEQVAQAIRGSSLDMPAGSIRAENGEIMLRTKNQAYSADDFARIVLIRNADGSRITLGDIADIRDAFVESDGFGLFDNKYSVGFVAYAVGEQDIISVAKAVKKYIKEKQPELPEGVYLDHWSDITQYLEGRIDMMLKNLAMGALLVFLVLSLFLEIKLAFWVMIGLPMCFLGTFALMPTALVDVNINMFSLFGFILVLGIVVDDAIIIGESSYTAIEKLGHSVDSVIRGTKRVSIPATFGVLTTIVAFAPTILADSVLAPFPAALGWVVILCLAFSLIESKLILPSHLAHSRPATSGPLLQVNRVSAWGNRNLRAVVDRVYLPALAKCLQNRYVTAGFFLSFLIVTAGLVGGGKVRLVIMPNMPSDFISAEINLTDGSPAWQVQDAYQKLYGALEQVDQTIGQESGGHSVIHHTMAWGYDTTAEMMVELTKDNEGKRINSEEISRLWREALPEIPGAEIIAISSANDMGGSDIGFRLLGKDTEVLKAAAAELEEKLSSYTGVYDVRNSASAVRDEIIFDLKPAADVLDISLSDIASQLRQGFYGVEAQRIQRGSNEVKVMVRYPESERRSIADLQSVYLRQADGNTIPLLSVADARVEPGFSRSLRISGQRAVRVTAEVDKNIAEPDTIYAKIKADFLPQLFQRYPGISEQPDGHSKESAILFKSLFGGFALSLLAIYALLAIPLRSYLQPLIIMGVIPFGIIGAVLGHMMMGIPLDMFSLFGIIALSGVVVNDSLILVDFINKARERGVAVREAVIAAGSLRMRAILLTSLTTFFGLLPMLLEDSLQAAMVLPMATSLGFGIIFATVITLLLVPCLYMIREDLLPSDPSNTDVAAPLANPKAISE